MIGSSPQDTTGSQERGALRPFYRRMFSPVCVVSVFVVIVGLLIFWRFQAARVEPSVDLAPPKAAATVADDSTTISSRPSVSSETETTQTAAQETFVATPADLVGTWVLNDGIRRVIEARRDGTATLFVQFDFLTSFRYGSELQLDLKWKLKDNLLVHEIVGGFPESGKKTLISDFGKKAYFKILRISQGEMHLVDFDTPPEEYLWKRQTVTPGKKAVGVRSDPSAGREN